jgi:hypothetical protein
MVEEGYDKNELVCRGFVTVKCLKKMIANS